MRGVKASIEERIANQQARVDKAKETYEAELAKLKDLKTEQEEQKKEDLIKAIESSGKSVDEVLKFLNS